MYHLGPATYSFEIVSIDTTGGFGGSCSTIIYLYLLVDHFTKYFTTYCQQMAICSEVFGVRKPTKNPFSSTTPSIGFVKIYNSPPNGRRRRSESTLRTARATVKNNDLFKNTVFARTLLFKLVRCVCVSYTPAIQNSAPVADLP